MASLTIDQLSDDPKIRDLCTMYWQFDEADKFSHTVAGLGIQFKIKPHEVSKLVQANSVAYFNDYRCPKCKEPHTFSNRAALLEDRHNVFGNRICRGCDSLEAIARQEAINAEIKRKRELIRSEFVFRNIGLFDSAELTLKDAVYLLSFVAASGTFETDCFGPLTSFQYRLSPTKEYNRKIVVHLYRHNFLGYHEASSFSAFEFEEDGIRSFYHDKVLWRLALRPSITENREAIAILNQTVRDGIWPEHWYQDITHVWAEIAHHECREYLRWRLDECDYPHPEDDKVDPILQQLLQDYSTGQVCYLIWRATQAAAHQRERGFVSHAHATNYLLKAMRKRGEDAKANGWAVHEFTRNTQCPITTIAHWYYSVFLGLGDAAFQTVILSDFTPL